MAVDEQLKSLSSVILIKPEKRPDLVDLFRPSWFKKYLYDVTAEQVRGEYKGARFGDLPPHVYAVAQHALQRMASTQNNQCILNLGISGSGKTSSVRHILEYYASTSAATGSNFTGEAKWG